MEDEYSKTNLEKNFLGKRVRKTSNDGNVFQPIWIRHNSVLSFIIDRKFVERKFNFVLYFGIVLWVSFFISKLF